jgi:hypothetical protein
MALVAGLLAAPVMSGSEAAAQELAVEIGRAIARSAMASASLALEWPNNTRAIGSPRSPIPVRPHVGLATLPVAVTVMTSFCTYERGDRRLRRVQGHEEFTPHLHHVKQPRASVVVPDDFLHCPHRVTSILGDPSEGDENQRPIRATCLG